jgi:aminoglycoside 6'-N-acetyltransferase I
MTRIVILGPGDEATLDAAAPDVFDLPVQRERAAEFLADPRHHIAVALDAATVVGFASAVHYVHPDKPPELWINEVGVAPTHRKQGVGTGLIQGLFGLGVELGCREAWVLTERTNRPAMQLYESLGGIEPPDETVMFSFRLAGHDGTSAQP